MNNLANGHARRAALSALIVGALLLAGTASPVAAALRPALTASAADTTPADPPGSRHLDTGADATKRALSISEPTASEARGVQGHAVQAETGQLTGRVYNVDGAALGGVLVSVFSSDWDGVTAWDYPLTFVETVATDPNGTFALTVPVGYYSLFFNPVDDPASAWSWLGGEAVPPQYPTLVESAGTWVDANLGTPHAIYGSVTGGPAKTPLAAPMTVLACKEREPDLLWCNRAWDFTSGTGGYSFVQMPQGYYLVEVRAPDARYKGEWWSNKPDFQTADLIYLVNGVDKPANVNLAQYVQVLPALALVGTAAVGKVVSLPAFTKVSGAAYQYVWYADSGVIPGTTNKTSITLTSAQAGKQISARVNASKSGYLTVNRFTAKTTRVIAHSAPTITGSLAVDRTITAVPNAWTTGTTFTYQWYAGGVAIPGATAPTYTLTLAERDKAIKVGIKGSKPGYTTLFRGSSETAKVAQIAKPTIAGTPKVGQKLTAKTAGWTPGTTFRYQWYASGAAISGATSTTLTVATAHVGKSLTVRVVGSKAGYVSFSQTSLPTSAVVK